MIVLFFVIVQELRNAQSLDSVLYRHFGTQICIEKSLCAHYLLNQWLEFDQNWFSLCYLGELQILQIECYSSILPASLAQLDAPSYWRPGGRGFNPRRVRQHSFVEIDHEIFSTVILSLTLIQEGQLSVSGERMCTILVNRLED